MRKQRFFAVLALFAVLTLVAAACGDDEGDGGTTGATGGTTGEPVEKIDVAVYGQGAWTGGASGLVLPAMQSAQLRFDELNADPSYPATITFEAADTQGSGDQAPPVAQQVAEDPNTVAVVGPAFSGESRAVGDTYNDNQIPFVTPSATADDLAEFDWDYWYRTIGHDSQQGGLAAEYVANVLQPESLYILHDTTDYGQPLAETVEAAAVEAGIEIAGKTGVSEPAIVTGTTVDFSSIISDIDASGADTVFFGGYDVDSGPFLNQAAAAGLDVQVVSGDGSVSTTLLELAGDGAEGTLLIAPSNIFSDFVAKYTEAVGADAFSVAIYAAEGYDVASVIGEGIKQAIEGGATDPVAIREGIKTYLDSLTTGGTFEGVSKTFAFDPETHELSTSPDEFYFFYEVQGGELVNLGNAGEVLGG
jgi:branched-chain amino acid transport system substrate-binding protein